MRKLIIAACGVVLAGATALTAQQGPKSINERLDGLQEDPGAVITSGRGTFNARINDGGTAIAYELSYANLERSITQSHIHIGTQAQSGGISVFLCTNLGNGPAGTQLCPASPATISGLATSVDVIGPVGQGIEAGALAELVEAMRDGKTYVNIHTTKWPAGEIRSQITHEGGLHR